MEQKKLKLNIMETNRNGLKLREKVLLKAQIRKKKILLICRDITKFKKLEFEIKESQARFGELADYVPEIQFWKLLQTREGKSVVQKTREMLELVLDNIPQLIYWKDTNLTYMGCNKNFALLNNIQEPTSIIGRKDEDLTWLKSQKDVHVRTITETIEVLRNFDSDRYSSYSFYHSFIRNFSYLSLFHIYSNYLTEDFFIRNLIEIQSSSIRRIWCPFFVAHAGMSVFDLGSVANISRILPGANFPIFSSAFNIGKGQSKPLTSIVLSQFSSFLVNYYDLMKVVYDWLLFINYIIKFCGK